MNEIQDQSNQKMNQLINALPENKIFNVKVMNIEDYLKMTSTKLY